MIDVKGTLLRTDSEGDGTYTMYVARPDGGCRCIQLLNLEFILAIYANLGPNKQVDFSFTNKE